MQIGIISCINNVIMRQFIAVEVIFNCQVLSVERHHHVKLYFEGTPVRDFQLK